VGRRGYSAQMRSCVYGGCGQAVVSVVSFKLRELRSNPIMKNGMSNGCCDSRRCAVCGVRGLSVTTGASD